MFFKILIFLGKVILAKNCPKTYFRYFFLKNSLIGTPLKLNFCLS
jgi:hypothetical protein